MKTFNISAAESIPEDEEKKEADPTEYGSLFE